MKKRDFFNHFFGVEVDFWGKNGDWGVSLQRIGGLGKIKTFENVRKYSKNSAKRLKIFEKWYETFENI